MESLYRKYRPLTFDSVVGQQHIVSTLEHAVLEGRLSHAYLFCGPRGTGKTTMARILAKALLCQGSDAAREEGAAGCMPDGTCEDCELIAEGSHPDVYELDAASRTGVDNVREEIINSVNFAPVRGKYKVYIIDEVHMLTTAAFNALLKTLEEPPAHVVFVLCTTDPQKILETILSRCQRFDFHRIGNEDIEGRLRYVCEQEGFEFDDEALGIVARHARGGMRDALSTLEQLSVFGAGEVRAADARSLLGEASNAVLGEFAAGIAARDIVSLFSLVEKQVNEGNDLLELTRDLVAHMRDVYMVRVAGRAGAPGAEAEAASALEAESGAFESADRIARALTVLDDAALAMRNAADARLVLEIALTRLARPAGELTIEALAERVAALEAQLAAGGAAVAPAGAVAAPAPAAGSAAPAATVPVAAQTAPAAQTRPAATPAPARAAAPAGEPAGANMAAAFPGMRRGAGAGRAASAAAASPAPAQTTAPAPAAASAQAPAPAAAPAQASARAAAPTDSVVRPERSAAAVAASAAPATDAVTDEGELQRKWAEVVQRAVRVSPSRGSLLQQARAESDDGSTLTVRFPAGSTFSMKMLGRADVQNIILPVIVAVFGSREVAYVSADGGAAKPAPHPEEPSPAKPSPQVAAAPVASAAAPATAKTQPTAPISAASKDVATPTAPASGAQKGTGATAVPSPSAPASAGESSAAASNAAVAPAPQHADSAASPRSDAPSREQPKQPAVDDDFVPYDDSVAAAYVDESELPPFDLPEAAPTPAAKPAPAPAPVTSTSERPARKPQGSSASRKMPWDNAAPSSPTASPSSSATGSAPAPTAAKDSVTAPAPPAPSGMFSHQTAAPRIPETIEESEELLREVFGNGIKVLPNEG